MKILITTDWYAPVVNGVVTSVMNLQQELTKRGHEVRILTLSVDGKRKKQEKVYYIKSFDIGKIYPQARGTVHFYDRYVDEIINWGPDIIHSQCELVSFPFAKRIATKCKCPIIHTYHTVYEDYTHYFTKHEQVGKKIVEAASRFILNQVNAVVAPTYKVTRMLREYGVYHYIDTIPTGIDLTKFRSRISAEERQQMREQYGISQDKQVLVFIGRLAKEKQVQSLIRSMKRIKQTKQNTVLLIVGDGPYRAELEQIRKTEALEEQVIFTGMISPGEVYKYYQLGDVFVCASESETQGLTYIEALASGLPLICRKDECLEDVVTDGYNGYQFETEEEFIQCVESLCNNRQLRIDMKMQAEKSAESFSAERFGIAVEELYYREIRRQGFAESLTFVHMIKQKFAITQH